MTRESTDTEWLSWVEVQKEVTRKWITQRDSSSALEAIRQFLALKPPKDLQREAIAFSSTIRQDEGDLEGARADLMKALELAPARDYVRFELEDAVALISEELNDIAEAAKWYTAALETAAADPRVAGGGFLLRFLEFRGERGLSRKERTLVKMVVHQGWHLLQVEGEPDLTDLTATANKLLRARSKPFSQARPPSPKAWEEPLDQE